MLATWTVKISKAGNTTHHLDTLSRLTARACATVGIRGTGTTLNIVEAHSLHTILAWLAISVVLALVIGLSGHAAPFQLLIAAKSRGTVQMVFTRNCAKTLALFQH